MTHTATPVTSSLLGPNILLSTLFSNTLTGEIIVLYFLIFMFLDSKREDKKRFWTEW
jgi:hypothetical protein